MNRRTTLLTVAQLLGAIALAAFMPVAHAAADAHAQEDIARHKQIAAAHQAAAQCVQDGGKPADCEARLKAACKGIAVGQHCGLRAGAGDYKDAARHIADHQTMVKAHTNAAACLTAGKPHGECEKALKQDCGGVGVGKYCGMRHAH
jgi:hypothetical protein